MSHTNTCLFLSSILAIAACSNDAASTPAGGAAPPDAQGAAANAQAATAPIAALPAEQGHSCGMESEPVKDTNETRSVDPATGAAVIAVGGKLGGAPVYTVADLMAHASELAGKTVRIEGNVSAMCTHMRAWFAVQDGGRSDAFVRVMTAPQFLVPEGSIGKRARAEGVVEIDETSLKTAEHLTESHQLQATPSKAVVIRATGAEFM